MANPSGIGGPKKGEVRNPNGKPSGKQDFVDRAKYLLDRHSIKDIKDYLKDESKFDALPVYDAMIIRRIAEAVSEDGRQSMDSLLDRLLGKPAQYVEQKIDATHEHKPVSATTEWLAEVIGSGSPVPPEKPVSD